MVLKAYRKLWMIRRLKRLGASTKDLVQVYTMQVRCIMELGVPAWQGGITQGEKVDLERVQKTACKIILGSSYLSYSHALETLELEDLEQRRLKLSLKFALRAEKHPKFKAWFVRNEKSTVTRSIPSRYCEPRARTNRFKSSPIHFLTRILNEHYRITYRN